MVIKKDQLQAINLRIEAAFAKELYIRLVDTGIISSQNVQSIEDVDRVVKYAIGAGIKSKSLIYEFCGLALTKNGLMYKPFSVGIKNILYSNAIASDKIRTLCIHFDKQMADRS